MESQQKWNEDVDGFQVISSFDDNPEDSRRLPYGVATACNAIIGIRCKDGVIIFGDRMLSYGPVIRFTGVQRIFRISDKLIVGGAGELADITFIVDMMKSKVQEDLMASGHCVTAEGMFEWAHEKFKKYDSEGVPRLCNLVVGGFDKEGDPFLGSLDPFGGSRILNALATGFAIIAVKPLLAYFFRHMRGGPTMNEARKVIPDIMAGLYETLTRCSPDYMVAEVDCNGATVKGPIDIEGRMEEYEYLASKSQEWQRIVNGEDSDSSDDNDSCEKNESNANDAEEKADAAVKINEEASGLQAEAENKND